MERMAQETVRTVRGAMLGAGQVIDAPGGRFVVDAVEHFSPAIGVGVDGRWEADGARASFTLGWDAAYDVVLTGPWQ